MHMCPLFRRFWIHSYCNQKMRIGIRLYPALLALTMVLNKEEYGHHCCSMMNNKQSIDCKHS